MFFAVSAAGAMEHIYIKALTDALVLTVDELRNFRLIVKNKATWTLHGMYVYISLIVLSSNRQDFKGVLYLYVYRGAFVVARFDNQGNAKAYLRWNEQQMRLHVFCV